MTILKRALDFARLYHKDQSYNGGPFIAHPIEVARFLEELGKSEDIIAAGYLHDILEDTDVTYDMVVKNFGEKIASLVRECTKSDYNTFPDLHSPEAILIVFVSRTCNIAHMTSWEYPRQQQYIQKSKFWKS